VADAAPLLDNFFYFFTVPCFLVSVVITLLPSGLPLMRVRRGGEKGGETKLKHANELFHSFRNNKAIHEN